MQISVPPFIPLIAVACVQAGHLAAHGRLLTLDAYSVEQLRHSFLQDWLRGS